MEVKYNGVSLRGLVEGHVYEVECSNGGYMWLKNAFGSITLVSKEDVEEMGIDKSAMKGDKIRFEVEGKEYFGFVDQVLTSGVNYILANGIAEGFLLDGNYTIVERHSESVRKAGEAIAEGMALGMARFVDAPLEILPTDIPKIERIEFGKVKEEPKTNRKDVQKEIQTNEIYRRVRMAMYAAQERQVAYGMDKYPETLTADTWTMLETLDHIISETTDKLHYLCMLRIKEEQRLMDEDAK